MTFSPISPQAPPGHREKGSQVTAFTEKNYGAGNETRTRDPDLGKIVPQVGQGTGFKGNSGFDLLGGNAQVIPGCCDAPSDASGALTGVQFGPGTLHDAQGRLLGHVAPSPPDVCAPITYPAPTADWGTVVAFAIPIDLRDQYPRRTPKEIRRYRYVRQLYRSRLTRHGLDTGPWFRSLLVVQVDKEAKRRAREAVKRWEASV